MDESELADVDIGEMNLLCAAGLAGAEGLDVEADLAKLDEWAERVRYWTDESLWDFRENPGKFENSEAKFRVLLLISVLQKEFGVRYDPDRGPRDVDFSDSNDAFIHGMLAGRPGTCASMPVLYVAVGRRLGYPMKLALAKGHIFARWNGSGGERFNIEGTNAQFADHPDEYYMSWPEKITPAELAEGWYLKDLTPAEELAVFVTTRGHCLADTGHESEAQVAFRTGYRLAGRDAPSQSPASIRPASAVSDPAEEYRRILANNAATQRQVQRSTPSPTGPPPGPTGRAVDPFEPVVPPGQ